MIELTALFHRPDSEYAYLYKKNVVHLRFRTKRNNVQSIRVHHGDPFIFTNKAINTKQKWKL